MMNARRFVTWLLLASLMVVSGLGPARARADPIRPAGSPWEKGNEARANIPGFWASSGQANTMQSDQVSYDVPCRVDLLIAAIHNANAGGQPSTLNLAAACTYTLITVDNVTDGPNGLPSVSGEIVIQGNGVTLARGDAPGTPEFRILHVGPSGDLTLDGLTVRNGNLSADAGGGIYNLDAVVTLIDSTITGNRASHSGGIANVWGRLTMLRSTVSGNQAQGSGGGVENADGRMTLTDSAVSGNTAGENGGGIDNMEGILILNNSQISDNQAAGKGGGISSWVPYLSQVTLTDSTVSGNRAEGDGGGIWSDQNPLVLVRSTVRHNTSSSGAGGGIYTRTPPQQDVEWVTLTDSTVRGNQAVKGGGIYNLDGTLTLTNSTVSDNTAVDGGGGLYVSYTRVTLTNSTISGNTTGGNGGGIYVESGPIDLTNVTISDNEAGQGGGIYNDDAATGRNSIVAGQRAGGDCGGANAIVSEGHNLDSDGSCALTASGDISNTVPLIGPLQDNGGPTKTHALWVGSPAIDAGDDSVCPVTDQRGLPRPQDGDGDDIPVCDIGAYELEAQIDIELDAFTATAGVGQITLAWETSAEPETAGFNLWRSETESGTYALINDSPVPAEGDPQSGAQYTYVDEGLVPGAIYYFKLEAVPTSGRSAFFGPVWATVGRDYTLYMPILIR